MNNKKTYKTYKLDKKRIRKHLKERDIQLTRIDIEEGKIYGKINKKEIWNQLRKNENMPPIKEDMIEPYQTPLWRTVIGILEEDFETRNVERVIFSTNRPRVRYAFYRLMEMEGYEEYKMEDFIFYKPNKMFAKKGEGVVLVEITELSNRVKTCILVPEKL